MLQLMRKMVQLMHILKRHIQSCIHLENTEATIIYWRFRNRFVAKALIQTETGFQDPQCS